MSTPDETIVIALPLPNRCLSPNFPCASLKGRFMRAAAAKKQRRMAKDATESAAAGAMWEAATIRAVFYHTKERRRDDVNALAMLKSAYDGIVDAGIIPDDDARHLTTTGAEFRIDRRCPRVEIFVTRTK